MIRARHYDVFRQCSCSFKRVADSAITSRATVRYASLSPIHAGLHKSRKAQSRDDPSAKAFAEAFAKARGRESGRNNSRTAKALDGARSPRQQHKLRKKLTRKERERLREEEGGGRQTRRKRFLDPDSSFGKKSLVYRLRHGDLQDTAAALRLEEPVRPRTVHSDERFSLGKAAKTFDRDQRNSPAKRREFDDRRKGEMPFGRGHLRGPRADGQRRAGVTGTSHRAETGWTRSRISTDEREPSPRNGRISSQTSMDEREHLSRNRRASESFSPARNKAPDRKERQVEDDSIEGKSAMPSEPTQRRAMSPRPTQTLIKYTTAASQFLYGASVVEAALQQARRKLYKLYVYGDQNLNPSKDFEELVRLATKREVPIEIVRTGGDGTRLLDKMSGFRAHNGCVLEASPLPQLPVSSLAQIEERPGRLGFHVCLDHQTKEERDVNGEETFIPRRNSVATKPFVLLLNEVLDPGNVGAVLRTANYFGVDAVAITNRSSCTVTPTVLKASSGAAEELPIMVVASADSFLRNSKEAGWQVFASVAPPEPALLRLHGAKFLTTAEVEKRSPLNQHPCILVLGNEGSGLPKAVKQASHWELSVPQSTTGSSVDSLNVGVAAGLLCHAFVKEFLGKGGKARAGDGVRAARSDVEGEAHGKLW